MENSIHYCVFLFVVDFFFSYPSVYIQFQIIFLLCIAALARFDTQKVISGSIPKMDSCRALYVCLFLISDKSVKHLSFINQWNECLKCKTYSNTPQAQKMQLLHKHLSSFNPQFLRTYVCTLMREENMNLLKLFGKNFFKNSPLMMLGYN